MHHCVRVSVQLNGNSYFWLELRSETNENTHFNEIPVNGEKSIIKRISANINILLAFPWHDDTRSGFGKLDKPPLINTLMLLLQLFIKFPRI